MSVMMPVAVRPTLVDPIGDVRWERLAATHPAGTAFHTPAWARVLVETYGYEPHYRALEGMDGELVAGLPSMLVRSFITGRRFVSLPFCDVCPPLINSDEEAIALLGLMVSDLSETGSRRIEVRGWSETAAPPASLIRSDAYVRHVVDLSSGPEAVFKGFNENMRRSIRKAEREKVRVRIGEDRADLATFVDLNLKLRRRHGMLPQPARFFAAVWKHFVEAGSGYLLLAERDAVPLAALLVLPRQPSPAVGKHAYGGGTRRHELRPGSQRRNRLRSPPVQGGLRRRPASSAILLLPTSRRRESGGSKGLKEEPVIDVCWPGARFSVQGRRKLGVQAPWIGPARCTPEPEVAWPSYGTDCIPSSPTYDATSWPFGRPALRS